MEDPALEEIHSREDREINHHAAPKQPSIVLFKSFESHASGPVKIAEYSAVQVSNANASVHCLNVISRTRSPDPEE